MSCYHRPRRFAPSHANHPLWRKWLAKHFETRDLPAHFSPQKWLQDVEDVQRHNANPHKTDVWELYESAGTEDPAFYLEETGDLPPTDAEIMDAYHNEQHQKATRDAMYGAGAAAPFWPQSSGDIDYRSYKDSTGKAISVLTPIKNQNKCGCCYIFAVTAALEAFIALSTKTTAASIAVQPFLNCFEDALQQHCEGGNSLTLIENMTILGDINKKVFAKASNNTGSSVDDFVFNDAMINAACDAIITNCDTVKTDPRCKNPTHTLMCNALLPCEKAGTCSCNYEYDNTCPASAKSGCTTPLKMNYLIVPFDISLPLLGMRASDFKTREKVFEATLRTYGPFKIAIWAPPELFKYKSGIFQDDRIYTDTNHAVVLVGVYTSVIYTDYWILRNSWGDKWGEGGYFKLPKGDDGWGPGGPLNMFGQLAVVFAPVP